jgi:hypothetical protein
VLDCIEAQRLRLRGPDVLSNVGEVSRVGMLFFKLMGEDGVGGS